MKPERDRGEVLRQYRLFARKAADISQIVSEQVLQPFWQAQRIPFVEAGYESHVETDIPLARSAAVAGASHLIAAVGAPAQPADEEGYEMASEYVALQYSVFIGYALRHIQNLLLCSVLSFVLLVVALNSFSFQTEAISRLLLAGLVAAGIVVVRALAQIERNPIISRISGTEEGSSREGLLLTDHHVRSAACDGSIGNSVPVGSPISKFLGRADFRGFEITSRPGCGACSLPICS